MPKSPYLKALFLLGIYSRTSSGVCKIFASVARLEALTDFAREPNTNGTMWATQPRPTATLPCPLFAQQPAGRLADAIVDFDPG